MKKTIFICFSTSEGSVSDHFVYLSNLLSKNLRVIIISDKKYYPRRLDKNITLEFWPSKRPTKLRDFFFYYLLLKKYRPLMTISLFGAVNINILTSYLFNIKYRIAWVRTLSTQFDINSYKVFRKSLVYKFATNIIANSYATANDASSVYNINSKKIKVLNNSVKDYYDDYSDIITDINKIVYVGRLHPSKGVDVLIKAFEVLADRYLELKLIIIGNGPQNDELKKLALRTGFMNRILFKGKKSKKKVLEEMKSSLTTIIPSYSEAFGFTVIEAMSMKTCVIGSDNSGIKEIIKHKKTGLLFETGSHKDLAKKLELIIENKDLRDRFAKNGYKRFQESYSTQIAVKRDANYFTNLIENS